jgi:hypothetical protein
VPRKYGVVLGVLAGGTTVLAVMAALFPPSPSTTPRAALAAAVAGCPDFPADNYWHADVSHASLHWRSDAWLSHMHTSRDLTPNFGPSGGDGPALGMPITLVGSAHDLVDVSFEFDGQSDHPQYPLGIDTRIEGGRDSDGDKHAVIVDQDACRLYETWRTRQDDLLNWHARSGATWDLTSNLLRPPGHISAAVSGLPILPSLLRWPEVRDGTLDHAIGFTMNPTSRWHVWPARHDGGPRGSRDFPPMGARFRLDASFDDSGYSDEAKTVIQALKTYGIVLVEKGAPWSLLGEQNSMWPISLINELKTIPASDFEAIDQRVLKIKPNTGQVQVPCGSSAPDGQNQAARVCR